MPCIQCSDGHWECGEDPRELCQGVWGPARLGSSREAQVVSKGSASGGLEAVPPDSGGWTKLGEFVAAFEVHYRIGFDGKPVVRIDHKTQRQHRPLPANNEHLGSGSRDE